MPLSYSPFDERVDFALNRPCAICRWADRRSVGATTGSSQRWPLPIAKKCSSGLGALTT